MSGVTVYFKDLSTPGPSGPITAWLWQFGDGATSGLQNPSHVYAANGVYNVVLTVTSPDGTAQVTHQVTIGTPSKLACAFQAAPNQLTVAFTDESTPGPSGPITGWVWNFGDGNTSTARNPSHTYASPGTYTVSLTVTGTSPDGSAALQQPVTVSGSVPPPTGQLLTTYDSPEGSTVNYSADWDVIKVAIPAVSSMMAPLDSSVIGHIGVSGQWCLIPAGMTASGFIQYGVPCWKTGLVNGFVVVDEPGSDSGSVALIKTIVAYVKANCTGVNAQGATVKTAVTQYDPGTLTALANDQLVDVLIMDNYPSRTGWDFGQWDQCVTACENALSGNKILEYWIVLDAFEANGYPAPTEAQLLSQISRSEATNAKRLVIYAWGEAGGTPLADLPGLVPALNTIPG